MAGIMQMAFSNRCIFLNENIKISYIFFLNLFFQVYLTLNMSTMVQIIVWNRKGDKPLSDQMMTQFTDAYMHHLTPMS